jgi:magnesium-transporting ATPase (P-type)
MPEKSEKNTNKVWHAEDVSQVMKELGTSEQGLNDDQVKERYERFGPNHLPEPPRQSPIMRLLRQFHNVLIYVLLISAIITGTMGHVIDTVVILAVVIANAVIGFIQEGKAERAMDAIGKMLAPEAIVLRNGEKHSIRAEELVPGDIVFIKSGDRVSADIRLLETNGLMIQESILTGESVPVEKNTDPLDQSAMLGDRNCMAYNSTLATRGQGMGVVVATGKETEIGHIGGMLAEIETLNTPLLAQIATFSKWLTAVILLLSGILLAYGYFAQQHDFALIFMAVVSLAVAAIPEGLPAVLTITLAIGVQAMARRHAIVRRLPAIETIGCVSVICTDKTGTLTHNEMMVSTLLTSENEYDVTGAGYVPEGQIRLENHPVNIIQSPLLGNLINAAILCNDSSLIHKNYEWIVNGDPMEGALLVLSHKAGVLAETVNEQWRRTDTIPFDSQHRFMATLHHDHEGHARILVKGAPEHVIEMCNQQMNADNQPGPLEKSYWNKKIETIANQGQRVLAVAMRSTSLQQSSLTFGEVEGELVLIGIIGLIDPPRKDAIEAVAVCRSAGIRVKMITGDHTVTAKAIGRQVGLENSDQVLTGLDLDKLDDKQLIEVVDKIDIFARASPAHKLRLVIALQNIGEVVAMTGDGVNDAPALKRADVGIAMGKKGSEAAKEASELVLANDDFASIMLAVREGRTVYNNVVKVIGWTLPTNAGETATITLALLAGMNLPVTPVQILWINLITVTTLGIAMAFEPPEAGTMQRPPRPRKQALLSGHIIRQIFLVSVIFLLFVFGIFLYATEQGYPIELARTMAMNTIVMMEIFYLFVVKNINRVKFNRDFAKATSTMWWTVSIIVLAQIAITYLPVMQEIFDTQSIAISDGLLILSAGILLFIITELEKQIRARFLTSSNK